MRRRGGGGRKSKRGGMSRRLRGGYAHGGLVSQLYKAAPALALAAISVHVETKPPDDEAATTPVVV